MKFSHFPDISYFHIFLISYALSRSATREATRLYHVHK